ncbi:hypothetical protein ABZT43_30685 [Streptomyces sp. NPDC005349]|uniref:hypothetical protein n=1 Tax=Streptomyces sp. NPDC005349 TaxID=3157037 RepID=UPI0033BAFDCF
MDSITVGGHLNPDTETVVRSFPGDDPFVSLRVGLGKVDVAFMAATGTSDVLRDIASAANKAAALLDELTASSTDGAA